MVVNVSNEEIAEVIEDGADYIEKWGWHQGDLYAWKAVSTYQDRPPACMMGGLMVGNRMRGALQQRVPMEILVGKFRKAAPEVGAISAWNDYVCQSQQQALDMMRLAAKRLRIGWEE